MHSKSVSFVAVVVDVVACWGCSLLVVASSLIVVVLEKSVDS